MKYLAFLFIVLFCQYSLFSQLEKAFNYDFGDDIQNITSKEYSLYIQKKDGIFNIRNLSVFNSKKINFFSLES